MAIEFRPSSAPKRKELPVEDRSGAQCPSPSLPDTSAGNPDVSSEARKIRVLLKSAEINVSKSKNIGASDIVDDVLRRFPGVTIEDIKGKSRKQKVVEARHQAIYALRLAKPNMSFPSIARFFGSGDHTSCLYAFNKIAKENGTMSSVEKQKANRSTAPRKDEARHGTGTTGRALTSTADRKLASGEAGTQALPVDTHSRAQFDRLKYQREYMRDRNTIKRLGLNMTVGEWRKSKGLD